MATDGGIIFERPAGVASGGFFCEGVSPKKSLVKIGEPSHTRRFASDRGEFSPNGVAILEFGPGRVSSGQGQASAAVRAREIGYCRMVSGVVDRGFAPLLPCDQYGPPPRFLGPSTTRSTRSVRPARRIGAPSTRPSKLSRSSIDRSMQVSPILR